GRAAPAWHATPGRTRGHPQPPVHPMARPSTPTGPPAVTFWGATRTVTGSMHQLNAGGKTILLDCGLFQGRRAEAAARNREFPFRAKDIDAVILSHAHIDHCGNLPNLV